MNAIIIDKDGYKVEFVLLEEVTELIDDENVKKIVPIEYELKEDEVIITEDIEVALSMLKPKWVENKWIEGATDEELQQKDEDLQKEIESLPKSQPSKVEILEQENLMLMQSQAELYEETLLLKSELEEQKQLNLSTMLAVTEIYESNL